MTLINKLPGQRRQLYNSKGVDSCEKTQFLGETLRAAPTLPQHFQSPGTAK